MKWQKLSVGINVLLVSRSLEQKTVRLQFEFKMPFELLSSCCFHLLTSGFTILLQLLVSLLDHGALFGKSAESLLYLPQLIQVAVLCPTLQS